MEQALRAQWTSALAPTGQHLGNEAVGPTRGPGYVRGPTRRGGHRAAAAPASRRRQSAPAGPGRAEPPSRRRARRGRRSCGPARCRTPAPERPTPPAHPAPAPRRRAVVARPAGPPRWRPQPPSPHPVRPLMGDLQHAAVAAGVGAERASRAQHLAGVAGLDRHRPLVRIHPDHHPVHHHPPHPDPAGRVSEDGQRCFEQSRPFSSHASPRCPAGSHAMKEPHQDERWAAASDSARTPTRD
jgi:hypothetical protein